MEENAGRACSSMVYVCRTSPLQSVVRLLPVQLHKYIVLSEYRIMDARLMMKHDICQAATSRLTTVCVHSPARPGSCPFGHFEFLT